MDAHMQQSTYSLPEIPTYHLQNDRLHWTNEKLVPVFYWYQLVCFADHR
ncbi:hypothetical protein [Paenibacillus campi]|nr:hypothetical protein [Paenibacillus sp. SGZ-1014]